MDAIIVIDNDAQQRACLKSILEFIDYERVRACSPEDWEQALEADEAGVFLVTEGAIKARPDLLTALHARAPKAPALILLAGRTPIATERGGSHVIEQLKRPLKYQALTSALQQALVYRESQDRQDGGHSPELFRSLVGAPGHRPGAPAGLSP